MSARRTSCTDAGGRVGGPARSCALTRAQHPPEKLIRFVLSPEGLIVPDLARRLPGRGVWVSATRDMVAKAVVAGAFQRSLKRPVEMPQDLPGQVESLLAKRVTEALGLANKAGLVVCGYSKVDAALTRRQVAALVHGTDAAQDGVARLDRKLKAIEADRGGQALVLRCLTIAQLSLALGRPNVVHAGLAPGGASVNFTSEAERLQRFRSDFGASMPAETPQVAKVEHG